MISNEWTVANIATWNKTRFPHNTEAGQYKKVKSEVREYKNAHSKEHKLEELADIYIALAGLSRFTEFGDVMCYVFEQTKEFEELKKAINNKMKINVTREFDEDMHHVG